MDLLNLKGWEVVTVDDETSPDDYHVHARPLRKPPICPVCDRTDGQRKDGRLKQVILDLPVHKRRVGIYLNRQRYECLHCPKHYCEPLTGVSANHNATDRLINYIGKAAAGTTFTALALETGYSISKIRLLFKEYVDRELKKQEFLTPTVLGVDEVYIKKRYYCVYTNIGDHTMYDMTEGRLEATVSSRLMQIEDYRRIEVVTIDMWDPYRIAVAGALPQAEIVADHWHVVRGATDALETIRKSHRRHLTDKQRKSLTRDRELFTKRFSKLKKDQKIRLKTYLDSYPRLKKAYAAKEEFFNIYRAPNPTKARKLYAAWLAGLDADTRPAFEKLIGTMTNWEKEIFNYFKHPEVTNGYTEAINGIVKLVVKTGRGYDFELLRGKMLLTHGLQKKKTSGYDRQAARSRYADTMSMMIDETPRTINYGVDLDLLREWLESGDFCRSDPHLPEPS